MHAKHAASIEDKGAATGGGRPVSRQFIRHVLESKFRLLHLGLNPNAKPRHHIV